ncbi:MAG: hypothetical protein ABSG68_00665 [Thermoguttaceae bacterium]|jgi:hypothetical protein
MVTGLQQWIADLLGRRRAATPSARDGRGANAAANLGRPLRTKPKFGRPLQLEPLESRKVLSVLGPMIPLIHTDPPLAGLYGPGHPFALKENWNSSGPLRDGGDAIAPQAAIFSADHTLGQAPGGYLAPFSSRPSEAWYPNGDGPSIVVSPLLTRRLPGDFAGEAGASLDGNLRPHREFLPVVEYVFAARPWMDPGGLAAAQDSATAGSTSPDVSVSSDLGNLPGGSLPNASDAPPAIVLATDAGWVGSLNAFAGQPYRATNQGTFSMEVSISPRPWAFAARTSMVRDVVIPASTRPATSGLGDAAAQGGNATIVTPPVAEETTTPGGGVALHSSESGRTSEWAVNWVSSPARAKSINAAEGGLIEIDDMLGTASPSSPGQGPSQAPAVPDAVATGLRADGAETDARPQAGSEAADQPDGDSAALAQDPARSFPTEEGGMVELAAVLPATDTARTSTADPETADPSPLVNRGEIRLDNSLGLIRAFELTTAPLGQTDELRPATAEAREPAPLPVTAASLPTANPPTKEVHPPARRTVDERLVPPTRAFPAIAVASLLAALDMVHVERETEKTIKRQDGKVAGNGRTPGQGGG